MKLTKTNGWLLGALFLVLAAILIRVCGAHHVALALTGLTFLFGITTTYIYPATGTTAPTAAQVARQCMVVAQVNMGDTDTTTTVTHNFNASAADQLLGFPLTEAQVQSPGTAIPTLAVGAPATNTVTISKLSANGSGGTYLVVCSRPHTLIR